LEDLKVSVYDDMNEKSERSYRILFIHPFTWGIIILLFFILLYIPRKLFFSHKKG
jgi:hypothetical protein